MDSLFTESAMVIQSHRLFLGDARVHYRAAGEEGLPVVLIHGGGSDHSGFAWKYALPSLGENYRVFAPDLPGYGASSLPSAGDGEQPFRDPLRYHQGFLGKFLDALALERVDLVGISMGGAICLGFALQHPRRVRRLVLVDSYGLGKKALGGRWMFAAAQAPFLTELLRFALQHSRTLIRWGLRGLVYDPRKLTPELVEEARRSVKRAGMHPIWKAFQRREITAAGRYRTCYREELPHLSLPTLLIHGSRDRLIPLAWARQAREHLPTGRLAVLENCGHIPPREMPEQFNQVVEKFLGETAADSGHFLF